MKEQALKLLEIIHKKTQEYYVLNLQVKKVQNADFPTYIQFMDDKTETEVVLLLDEVLGDKIATYFLYECGYLEKNGKITEADSTVYPIKTIEDVRKYVNRV